MIKKILVSQPQPTSEKSPYYDLESEFKVQCVFRPFVKVEGLSAKEFRQQKVSILDYSAIVFTSRHAIDHFFTIAKEMMITIPETMKYFCVTETVSLYIQKYVQYRKRKVFYGTTGKVQDLVPVMVKHKSEKYLVPMSSVHTDELKNLLDERKLNHTECVMYRTVSNDLTKEEVKSFDYDMLVFFSPSGIQSLLKNFPKFKQKDICIAAFGPSTCKAVTDAGLRLDIEAPTANHPSMPSALKAWLKENQKEEPVKKAPAATAKKASTTAAKKASTTKKTSTAKKTATPKKATTAKVAAAKKTTTAQKATTKAVKKTTKKVAS
ncbi:MAG: uroporphyrinogen-III synthase [Prevotella sp.]|nr:uroporphyrinogen-III synthase [Prevotella sp.]